MASVWSEQIDLEMTVPKPESLKRPMHIREKQLMGPGPSNPSETVYNALSRPMMGHMHTETFKVSVIECPLPETSQFLPLIYIHCDSESR